MVEMSEVADIVKHATKNSLVILDEVGRGTSTFDGISIARAVSEYISTSKSLGCKTLFATHYHELICLEDELSGVRNYSVAVKRQGDSIKFLRKIVQGGVDESYGIEVAKLAGVPNAVVNRAKAILSELEEKGAVTVIRTVEKSNDDDMQISFASNVGNEIVDEIKMIDINTLTPIEALQKLYELKKRAENL
jgi:DNA mismatch repair protein MutS